MILARILGTDVHGNPDEEQRDWLVGNPARSIREHTWASNEQLTFLRNQQSINGAGWLTRKLRDQRNQGADLMLSTVRLFATHRACFTWRMALASANDEDKPHRMKGAVILRCQEGAGFDEVILRDSLILASSAVPVGLSLALTYGIKALSIEPYQSGEAYITITALSGIQAYAVIPDDQFSDEGWTLEIDVTDSGVLSASFSYLVQTVSGNPIIIDAFEQIRNDLIAFYHVAVDYDGGSLRIWSQAIGPTSQVQIRIYNDLSVLQNTYTGNGTTGTQETVNVDEVEIYADNLL